MWKELCVNNCRIHILLICVEYSFCFFRTSSTLIAHKLGHCRWWRFFHQINNKKIVCIFAGVLRLHIDQHKSFLSLKPFKISAKRIFVNGSSTSLNCLIKNIVGALFHLTRFNIDESIYSIFGIRQRGFFIRQRGFCIRQKGFWQTINTRRVYSLHSTLLSLQF